MSTEAGDIKVWLAEKAAGIVNGARRKGYGLPKDNFHRIALLWQAWLDARELRIVAANSSDSEYEYRLKAEDISPMMRLMKEARLIESPAHTDSLLDIIGYTMTGAEVNGAEVPPPETEARKEELLKENEELKALIVAQQRVLENLQSQLFGSIGSKYASIDPNAASLEAAQKAREAAMNTTP